MNKRVKTNLNEFILPYIVKSDDDYYIELKNYLARYIKHVKEKMAGFDDECSNKTQENINLIIDALKLYNKGEFASAKDSIKKIVEKYCNEPYIVATIDNNYAFRGMSPEALQPKQFKDDSDYKKIYKKMKEHQLSFFKGRVAVENINRRDMLHIPFNKRGLITTQRFSMSGVPCLYLSTTSLGCWLELNMPQLELFQISSYKIPDDLKILNMCISQYTINGSICGGNVDESEYKATCALIELFPLVCATSFQVLEMNRDFKSEYIIPQLLMQAVNELEIDGVAYLSKKMKDIDAYPQAVNLAILMKSEKLPPYSKDGFDMYWKRSNEIELTDPFRSNEISQQSDNDLYKSYVNEIYKDHELHKNVTLVGNELVYTNTTFSKFDEFLVRQKHYKFRE